MDNVYFRFLVGLIGDDYICGHYQKLLWKLFCRDYIWELELDENRAADGIRLRLLCAQQYGLTYNNYPAMLSIGIDTNRPCSMLEMMIAIARRAEDDLMHDPDFGDRTGKWFWQIIENLGIDLYDDYHWIEPEVDRILDIFIHHEYQNVGIGCAFPIRKTTRDPRTTDLWWQMNAYMSERYAM